MHTAIYYGHRTLSLSRMWRWFAVDATQKLTGLEIRAYQAFSINFMSAEPRSDQMTIPLLISFTGCISDYIQ